MILIERAKIEDVEVITEINTQAFNDEMRRTLGRDGGPPGYNKISTHINLINKFLVYKIIYEGKIIGSFFLVKRGEDHLRLESFCIFPLYQNKGFGYMDLQLMEKEHQKIKKWSLSSAKDSKRIQHLYEKFGYVKTGENEWEYEYEKLISDIEQDVGK